MTCQVDITLDDIGRPDAASSVRIAERLGPIVDAHHHFWNLEANSYPWLQDRPIKAHFGDYSAIRRNYLPRDLRADLGPVHLAGSVHVEAHWRGGTLPAGETAWLAGQAADQGLPTAMMGAADLRAPDLAEVLDAHADHNGFRGIRVMAMGRGAPEGAALYRDAAFLRGIATVFDRGLCVDLQAPPSTQDAVADLAAAFPKARIALTHSGLPLDRSVDGLAQWRAGIARLEKAPNVCVKLSGLAMTDWKWSVASLEPLVRHLLESFGPARLMFGSNFPVDKLFSDYPTLLAGYVAALGDIRTAELKAIFHDNALKFYRLEPVFAARKAACNV